MLIPQHLHVRTTHDTADVEGGRILNLKEVEVERVFPGHSARLAPTILSSRSERIIERRTASYIAGRSFYARYGSSKGPLALTASKKDNGSVAPVERNTRQYSNPRDTVEHL